MTSRALLLSLLVLHALIRASSALVLLDFGLQFVHVKLRDLFATPHFLKTDWVCMTLAMILCDFTRASKGTA